MRGISGIQFNIIKEGTRHFWAFGKLCAEEERASLYKPTGGQKAILRGRSYPRPRFFPRHVETNDISRKIDFPFRVGIILRRR